LESQTFPHSPEATRITVAIEASRLEIASGTVRRAHARTFSDRALLAFGKPHPVSELHARTFSTRALLAFGKSHPVSELRWPGGQAHPRPPEARRVTIATRTRHSEIASDKGRRARGPGLRKTVRGASRLGVAPNE